jgi:hypothetical protein
MMHNLLEKIALLTSDTQQIITGEAAQEHGHNIFDYDAEWS